MTRKRVNLSSRSSDILYDYSQLAQLDHDQCWLVVVSDWDIALLLSTVRYAEWETRWVNQPVDFQVIRDEVARLEHCLMSGCNLSDLGASIERAAQLIADSMRVSSGAGNCYNAAPVLGCLSQYTADELLDTPADGVDPAGETVPDGFASMAEYLAYKCKVAHAILDDITHFFRGLQGISAFMTTVAAITPVLGAALIGTGAIAVPPAAVAEIGVAILATILLSGVAFNVGGTIADYIESHRSILVCELYQSSAPAQALTAITNEVEDAIQSVQWEAVFGPALGPQIAAAFGTIAGELESNGLVNSLFRLTLDIVYPEKDCSDCLDAISWHFDSDAQGWEFVQQDGAQWHLAHAWTDDEQPVDNLDTSAGALWASCNKGSTAPPFAFYWHRSVLGYGITAHEGDQFRADFWYTSADHSGHFITIIYSDDTEDEQYYPNVSGQTWEQLSVTVTAANDGKTVKELRANSHTGEATGSWDYGMDRAQWVAA